jgi:SAM-dependent methyltransferase
MDIKQPQKQEWFETWFDTPYYHILYEHRNEKEAEQFLDSLLDYLQLPPRAFVLDVACGTGRYSLFLANKKFNVTGIDLSWKNIQLASKYETDNLTFFLHDMRSPFYINYFDAAFNFFTSFGYFSSEKDNLKAIHSLSHSLKPGGKLVIDFFNSEKVIRKIKPEEKINLGGIEFTIRKNIEQRVIVKKISFTHHGKDLEFEERVQALQLEDFQRYFQLYGLQLKDVFGDYQLHPFDRPESNRMILIAEKI